MEGFLLLILVVVVAAFGFFVIRHKDDFEDLLKRDLVEVKEEAKKVEDKARAELREFDDKVREEVSQKIKKIRARRK